jgi:phosphate transport system substrate-binding protein
MTQLRQIYSGEVHAWNDVGGQAGPIHVVVREKSARSRKSFADLVMQGHDLADDAREVDGIAAMIEVVKLDTAAVGYLTLKNESKDVKRIQIDEVEMTRFTLLSGRYPLSRSFFLTVYNPGQLAERFVQFVISKEGQELLAADGLVPVYY